MASKLIIIAFYLFLLSLHLKSSSSSSSSQNSSRVRAGYYHAGSEISVSDIKSSLFTHLICAFAYINASNNYKLSINSSDEQSFSTFTHTVRRQNPSLTTLLSIWGGEEDQSSTFSSMINHSSHRKSFIHSSIITARLYGFHGLDLYGIGPKVASEITNIGTLLKEWREALTFEARNSGKPELMLMMTGYNLQGSLSYPFDSMQENLDWVHFVAYDYYLPTEQKFIGFHAALYSPTVWANTDDGIKEWKRRAFLGSKMVIGLPYHGYAWKLENPRNCSVGSPTLGPALTMDGFVAYKLIKSYIRSYGEGSAGECYNGSYVVNQFRVGSTWINFDDAEAIRAKVSYAKKNGLLGYSVFQVGNDENWIFSRAAAREEEEEGGGGNRSLLIIVVVTTSTIAILLLMGCTLLGYFRRKVHKSRGTVAPIESILHEPKSYSSAAERNLDTNNASYLLVFKYSTIEVATDNFSNVNKLGEGGFGTVYKGILPMGEEVAVKRLYKTSDQGLEEFKNEVTLTARLQHVNFIKLIGYCTEKNEKMLIYEYMPNGSLDLFLFDPNRSILLDWSKRVNIIEGVIQGLLYLQEYSNFTIIHRDLKASNILLDHEMNLKISDFRMAKMFRKDRLEAITKKIVGTYGYVPPEYVRKGIYSMKYDVYSFGVLLLQIISGKRTSCYYGVHENLNILEYAYNLWREGKGMELTEPWLDDAISPCKIMRCMQLVLLCVQENPEDRPSMLQVFSLLKNETAAIGTPKKPAFSIKRDEDAEGPHQWRVKFSSINDVTISQVSPR